MSMSLTLRGGRRHYARLQREARKVIERVDAGEAFAMWHHHFDDRGFGNGREATRRRHLEVLFAALAGLLQTARVRAGQVQVFASIAPAREGADDALYVHAQGADATPYPYRYPGVRWNVRPPAFLHGVPSLRGLQVGELEYEGRRWWVVVHPSDPGLA